MALYYVNHLDGKTIFYTDTGGLRNLLLFADQCEQVRIPYLLGRHDVTNKLMYLKNGKATGSINACMKDNLVASVQAKLLSDARIILSEFQIQFECGISAHTDKGDVIVVLNSQARLVHLLESFGVPIRVCPAILTHPGTLYNVTHRTGSFYEHGYFRNIQDWLDLVKYEKPSRRLCFKPESN